MSLSIAILGAGVGGLSTAIALKRKGFEVTVYERRESGPAMGAGIVCWPNATFVLDELGLLDDITAVSAQPVAMQRWSCQGDVLGTLDMSLLNHHMGYSSLSVLRRDLMAVLERHARALGITLNYQHKIIGITARQQQTSRIEFDNGRHVQADVVIGADGRMNSIARRFVHGDNRPVYQGFINWIGVFESEQAVFDPLAILDHWGIGERFGIVPVAANRAYWAGAVAADEIAADDPDGYKQELLTLFAHWPDPIPQIIAQTDDNQISKIYVHDHDPLDRWHRSNVLLIGDAAHAPLPTSGQGACQALEDAWHLARLFGQHGADLLTVFDSFRQVRLEKTTHITLAARQFAASLFNRDPQFCVQRNRNSLETDYGQVVQGMAKTWAKGLPLGIMA